MRNPNQPERASAVRRCYFVFQRCLYHDFGFATGAPRKQTMELASRAFIERAENVVFL